MVYLYWKNYFMQNFLPILFLFWLSFHILELMRWWKKKKYVQKVNKNETWWKKNSEHEHALRFSGITEMIRVKLCMMFLLLCCCRISSMKLSTQLNTFAMAPNKYYTNDRQHEQHKGWVLVVVLKKERSKERITKKKVALTCNSLARKENRQILMTFQHKAFEGCQTYKLCRWMNLMKIRKRISDRTWNKNRQSWEIVRTDPG